MRIFDPKNGVNKLKQEVSLRGKILNVDSLIHGKLRDGYKAELKEDLELPRIYEMPFAIVHGASDLMLFWASTESDRQAWCKAFAAIKLKTTASQ